MWGRDPGKAAALARDIGAGPYADIDEMLADVDAVAFAVPPDVQAPIAARAARAGKHLLLDKPLATSQPAAAEVVAAVEESGVSSVVFFTNRFDPTVRSWLAEVEQQGGWYGASALWLGAAFTPGSPYADSVWRRERGGLWDVGPHAISMLTAALGRVTRVTAVAGQRELVQLVLTHEGGATSTATLTLDAPPAAAGVELTLWGRAGRSAMPVGGQSAATLLAVAVQELVDNARHARHHRAEHMCDARFGGYVVDVLAEAERALAARTPAPSQPSMEEWLESMRERHTRSEDIDIPACSMRSVRTQRHRLTPMGVPDRSRPRDPSSGKTARPRAREHELVAGTRSTGYRLLHCHRRYRRRAEEPAVRSSKIAILCGIPSARLSCPTDRD